MLQYVAMGLFESPRCWHIETISCFPFFLLSSSYFLRRNAKNISKFPFSVVAEKRIMSNRFWHMELILTGTRSFQLATKSSDRYI